MFTNTLGGSAKGLFYDIHSHFKWCADQREALGHVADIIDINSNLPQDRTRWLSTLDCTCDTISMLDVYTLIFYSYLDHQDRSVDVYQYNGVAEEAKIKVRTLKKGIRKTLIHFKRESKGTEDYGSHILQQKRDNVHLAFVYCSSRKAERIRTPVSENRTNDSQALSRNWGAVETFFLFSLALIYYVRSQAMKLIS